jgi:hypothetical protein
MYLTEAAGVNLRTLQHRESGRSLIPKPIEKLILLMKKMPSAKKYLSADV